MPCHMDFDFDLMAKLAKEDPQEFARRREELIRQAIETLPDPDEGRRIQFEIDLERLRTTPGEKACVAMAQRLCMLLGQISSLYADIGKIVAQQGVRIERLQTVK